MNKLTLRIQSQSDSASNQGDTHQERESNRLLTTTEPVSSKSTHRSDGPCILTYESPRGSYDCLVGVRPEQIVDSAFDCMISSDDVAYDDIDNDSIEIARKQRSVDRAIKKRRTTAENVRKKLRELQAKIDANEKTSSPTKTERHVNVPISYPIIGMQIVLCSN